MSTLPHVHTYSWIVLLKHRRISSVYTGSGSRTTATTQKDIHFCYCYWLWLEAFTIAPLRTTLDVSRVLQILFRLLLFLRYFSNIFLVQFFIFKNFDKVNAHLVYSASATIFQYICSETPILFVHAHSLSTRQFNATAHFTNQRAVPEEVSYNHFHNILRLFDLLPNFPFTTNETMGDNGMYELPRDLTLRISGNQEIPEKCLNLIERHPGVQSSCQNENFFNPRKKFLKKQKLIFKC